LIRSAAGHADVGGHEQLFERPIVAIASLARARCPGHRLSDDSSEPIDDLLFGAGEALADPAQHAHLPDLIAGAWTGAWRRPAFQGKR